MSKRRKRPTTKKKRPISPTIVIGAIIAAILVMGSIIIVSQNQGASAEVDMSQFPTKGEADAPVLIVEFSDYR